MRAFTITPKRATHNRRVNKRLSPNRLIVVSKLSCSSRFRQGTSSRTGRILGASHRLFATSAEETSNLRRWQESGGGQGSSNQWKWTLNWNEVEEDVIVGSCPRSPSDIDTIAEETEANAILSVQSDLCLDALQIDYAALREHGLSRGILMSRVPIRDFDHGDQSLMLPEAVRTLALLLALNYRVYVHCTAGINRATLTVLGYLTFVKGRDLYSALEQIKKARPQANPYIDCWKTVKRRLLEGRQEEVVNWSRKVFLKNQDGSTMDSFGNWVAAEDIVIKETFRRLLSSTLNTISAMTDLKAESLCSVCIHPQEIDQANREIQDLKYELNQQRKRLAEATEALEMEKLEHEQHLRHPVEEVNGFGEVKGTEVYNELLRSQSEVGELKNSIRKIAQATTEALSMVSMDSYDDVEIQEAPGEDQPILEETGVLENADEIQQ